MNNDLILVDSNILIWHLRGMDRISIEVNRLIDKNSLYISPIIIAEILAGAKKKETEIINNLFSLMNIIDINKEVGKIAGEYLAAFSKSHGLEIADALIAASVTFGKMKLWSLNKKHYPMLDKKDFYDFDLIT